MLTIRGIIKKVSVGADGGVIDVGIAAEYGGETLQMLGDLYGSTVEVTLEEVDVTPPKAARDPNQRDLPLDGEDLKGERVPEVTS